MRHDHPRAAAAHIDRMCALLAEAVDDGDDALTDQLLTAMDNNEIVAALVRLAVRSAWALQDRDQGRATYWRRAMTTTSTHIRAERMSR